MSTTVSDHWASLVATAVLGTSRRSPPPPPPGVLDVLRLGSGAQRPGARHVDDLGAEEGDDASVVLDQVAALTAIRRAGLRPSAAPPPLPPCPIDSRPECPSAAIRRLTDLLQSWPVLVDEWLACLETRGLRLAPEHVVTLLIRYRTDPARRSRVIAAAGPLAEWLDRLFPALLGTRRVGGRLNANANAKANGNVSGYGSGRSSGGSGAARAGAADAAYSGLPLPPDLAPLVGLPPDEIAAALAEGLDKRRWVHRHRSLLVRLLCVVEPAALPAVAERLAVAVLEPGNVALAADLAHLARTRAEMLAELGHHPDSARPAPPEVRQPEEELRS